MKKQLHVLLFIAFAASLGACKPIGEKIFTGLTKPIFNPELMTLVGSLISYKETFQHWPDNVAALQTEFIVDSVGLKLDHYKKLNWTTKQDTIFVGFELAYSDNDTSKFRFLNGDIVLFMNQDTIFTEMTNMVGETKDGTLRWGKPTKEPAKRSRNPNALHLFPSTSEK
ncbi:hypothetical protein FVR03_08540 [Pontibacter qinzhouensis]|uniref:Lipoprotein n=1 Tax=Pontibacter qinzhouensis TaxID=2603253 RepID=A0A5C8KCB7_9BACT|nr:hypothetical protein [Pontibacter qinzhouensis]TXK48068.1 hypothetical protein FVR03_08540 [Pontibacter qinzhouensis]